MLRGAPGIYLISALSVARVEADGLVEVAPAGGGVHAGLAAVAQVADLSAEGALDRGRTLAEECFMGKVVTFSPRRDALKEVFVVDMILGPFGGAVGPLKCVWQFGARQVRIRPICSSKIRS